MADVIEPGVLAHRRGVLAAGPRSTYNVVSVGDRLGTVCEPEGCRVCLAVPGLAGR